MDQSFEAQLRTTLNMIPAFTWYAAPSGALTFVNERFANYLGLPNDDPLRLGTATGSAWDSYVRLLHPDHHEETRRIWSECLTTGRPGEASVRVRNAEGGYRWFLSRTEPSRAADGTVLCWIGINVDVTERKVAEEAVRRSEAYLAEAQRLSHTGSFGWKVSSGEIFWSVETFRIFECDPGTTPTVELVLSRVHPDDRSLVQQHIDRAPRDRAGFDFEHRLQLPDGSVKHVRVTAHPSWDSAGNVEFVGAVTDITQQRLAEAVIRRQEAELRDVVDTIPAIVWSALPDGSNAYVNSRFVEYCGMQPQQIAGTGWHAATHPDDLERHNAKWLACAASGEPLEDEVRFRRSDGQYRWHLQRGIPLRDGAGRIVKWYGVLTDIEDRKRAEDRIRDQETELRQILDFAPQLIAVYGPNFQRLYANREALDYAGVSLEAWRNTSERSAFVHPDDRAREHDQAGRQSPYTLELRLRKSGRQLSLVSRSVQSRPGRQGPDHSLVYLLHRYRGSQAGGRETAAGKRGAAGRNRQDLDVRRDRRRLACADRCPVAAV